ncbi:MAG: hypothetical protein JSR34_04155 [Proteobacteria bacterium]|nr:hypothetical protein [Pseudomonadota bacterium]
MPDPRPAPRPVHNPARHPLLDIATYPLQSASLTSLAAMAILMPLTMLPLAGLLAQFAIWTAAYYYAVEVFQRSAHGTVGAPEFAREHDGIGWKLVILQMGLSILQWLLPIWVFEPLPRALGIGLIAMLQPAMTLTAAMDRLLAGAFRPLRVLRVIGALGARYGLLVLAGIGMGLLAQWVGTIVAGGRAYLLSITSAISLGGRTEVGAFFAGNGMLAAVGMIVAGFAWFYAVTAYFRAMGLIVNARSQALGFTPAPQRKLRPEDHHAALLRRVEDLAEQEHYAAAALTLGECLQTQPHGSPAMHARYRELLHRCGDEAGLLEHARTRIDALLAAGQGREALTLAREALAVDPQFRPGSGERTTELTRHAQRQGQADIALTLLRDFTARHPRDPAIPDNAVLAAELLVERHGDIDGARAVLQAAIDHMLPAHPRHAELVERHARLDGLPQTTPTGARSS